MKGSPRVAGIWGVFKVLAIDFRPVFGSPWLPLQGKGMILYQVILRLLPSFHASGRLGRICCPVSRLPVDGKGS